MNNTALRIQTTGEAVRGMINLHIKEHDRILARIETALATATKDLAEADKNSADEFERVRQRPAPIRAGHLGYIGGHESIGLSEVNGAKNQISSLENQIAALRHSRAQMTWLHDQFNPSATYELGTGDLMLFGIGYSLAGLRGALPFVDC